VVNPVKVFLLAVKAFHFHNQLEWPWNAFFQ